MTRSPIEPSPREQQVAMSVLAHVARHDADAVAASLVVMADEAEHLRPIGIIAALLDQFELGMDDSDESRAIANWFAGEAQAIAAGKPAA